MQSSSKDFKTKKIIVDDVKSFFARYGTMVDHQIMFDHETKRSRGFGFIVFASDSKVEIKKAEPKKSSNAPPPPLYGRNARLAYDSGSRDHPSANNYGGMPNAYANYRGGGFGPYRSDAGFGGRLGNYGGTGDFGSTYGRYYAGLGGYGATTVLSFDYHNRFGLYGGGFGGAYAGADLVATGVVAVMRASVPLVILGLLVMLMKALVALVILALVSPPMVVHMIIH
ncbi:Heterogeneous nuclear ribonucleoprotein 27C [Zea mays]|uniref:Heterogeneous nuclear ribonucleoprotein 27C n=1 Tax=Zea mays TaxID=4577 RepID=A0A317YCU3_MAIZE|nr:Heterogeneous nuclear ribonucleoprotein 27C [Zea mays]